jgi:DNA-binding GntR family transcriptional regulator
MRAGTPAEASHGTGGGAASSAVGNDSGTQARRRDGQTAPPDSYVDYALERIRRAIRAGTLRPGDRIATDALAEDLGISHIPVREALRMLEAEGHLVREGRRLRVAGLSSREAEDIYLTRALLERAALELGVPRLTANDDIRLGALVDQLERAAEAGDDLRYHELTRQFHFLPFERARRPWLLRFLRILWDASARYQRALFQPGRWRTDHVAHHRQLLEALRQRDVDRVDAILAQHRHWLIEQATQVDGAAEVAG